MKSTLKNKKAVKVTYSAADLKEMRSDARAHLIDGGIARPTAKQIDAEIAANHGKVRGVRSSKKTTAKAAPKSKRGAKTTVFGFSVASVARRLGKNGFKPSAAIAAIRSKAPKASVAAIRTYVQAGRQGLRGAPAKLDKTQLATLKTAAAK